jgi:hypothetical protein
VLPDNGLQGRHNYWHRDIRKLVEVTETNGYKEVTEVTQAMG